MGEREVLDYLRGYGFDYPSLEGAFEAEPQKTLEHLNSMSYHHGPWFTPTVLERVLVRFESSPRHVFGILHQLAAADPDRQRSLMELFAAHFPRFPKEAIEELYYVATNHPHLLRPWLVYLLCEHAEASPYEAFHALQHVLSKRPELVQERVVKAVVDRLKLAVNQAFHFIREVIRQRPEYTPLCTVALFECVLSEPHPYVKGEMLSDISVIAGQSHVKTELARALGEPPAAGTLRARALMALLFRQKLRARQRVLLDALLQATKWTHVWNFLLFLLDAGDPKAVSTAAAEEFLEGAYRFSLLVSPYEFETLFASRLDADEAPPAEFPREVAFLAEDEELAALHRRVSSLASKFGATLELAPVREYFEREEGARREREAITRIRREATTRRRARLELRKESLRSRMERWATPEGRLTAEQRQAVLQERRELGKRVRDALRAAAARVAVEAVRSATKAAYALVVRRVLGRDVELEGVDPAVLPAFLYFERLGRLPNNRKYLARLIEDRLEGRPHDWLWTEEPAARWAQRMRDAERYIRLENWRAPFTRTYSYRPIQAANEKRRRIRQDLAQTRDLFARLKVEVEGADYEALRRKFMAVEAMPPKGADPAVIEEIGTNLERIRVAEQTADSDYEGKIELAVEADPFQYLFMGEYGFASCLSLRGVNVWSAVSNAIDVDKAVVWAREPGGNIVGRRLLALTAQGIVSYRTYTNQYGLSLDGFFESFLKEYAEHCGTVVTHGVSPGPLLSDDWYDDGAL